VRRCACPLPATRENISIAFSDVCEGRTRAPKTGAVGVFLDSGPPVDYVRAMNSSRIPSRFLAAGVAVLIAGSAAALAATAVPFAKLSPADRLTNAPDSTVVTLGPRTVTLGQLRASHRAREASLLRAGSLGSAMHGRLTSTVRSGLSPGIQGGTTTTVQGGGGTHTLVNRPGGAINPGSLAPQAFVEPSSQYASSPADMKAFCSAARASACLYLPPGQEVTAQSYGVADWDGLVTQSQCAQEGGSWGSIWNGSFCAFNYPASVTVHFTPAANFKLTQTANCDPSTFAYKVDTHGAIQISLSFPLPVIITTDNDPTCVVSVTPGG